MLNVSSSSSSSNNNNNNNKSLYSSKSVQVANMPALWFQPSSSEPVIEGQNSNIKMGD